MSSTNIKSRMGLVEWSMLIVLSILWGSSYFFIEIALTEWTPLLIVAVRVSIAAALIWTLVLASGVPIPRSRSAWTAFFLMGVLNNVIPFVLIVWGQTEIGAGLASILNAATPIFTVLVAGLLLKDEPVTRTKLLGAFLGLVGVIFLIGPSALAGIDANLLAQLAVLGAGLSYAFAGVYGRRFAHMKISPMAVAAGQLFASSIILVFLALVFSTPAEILSSSAKVWASVGAMAVLSTALAYILYFRLLATAGATNALLVTLLIPVTAVLLGAVILGERLHALHFTGMAVVALGLLVIDGRIFARNDSGIGRE